MLGAHGRYIQRYIKTYDRDLFVDHDARGNLCVLRRRFRYDHFNVDGCTLLYGRPDPEFVFALTNTWAQRGQPINWGPEVVLARLRKIDFWDNHRYFEEMERQNELVDEGRKKDFRNKCESMASEWRTAFKKGFDWVNTSTLDKKLDPRRKYDGNREPRT
jgi:hypothetical protein